MSKYIDEEKLKSEIKSLNSLVPYTNNDRHNDGLHDAYKAVKNIIESLQQEQPEDISVPKWLLENIEDTLRIQNNINNDKKSWETCQDRNIRECLNGVRKILNGEELTGMERLEPLKKQQKMELEKEIEKYFGGYWPGMETAEQCNTHMQFTPPAIMRLAKHFFELGLNARKV